MANTWHGAFPYRTTGPTAGCALRRWSPPNGYGLFDMAGNVWEWTDDFYSAASGEPPVRSCCAPRNPRVPAPVADSYRPDEPGGRIARRVTKGGSHLCAPNYCLRYRPAARQGEAVDTSTGHIGFRCVIRAALKVADNYPRGVPERDAMARVARRGRVVGAGLLRETGEPALEGRRRMRVPFKGVINVDVRDSQPDWPPLWSRPAHRTSST